MTKREDTRLYWFLNGTMVHRGFKNEETDGGVIFHMAREEDGKEYAVHSSSVFRNPEDKERLISNLQESIYYLEHNIELLKTNPHAQ